MAEANDIKFGMLLGFAKSNYNITPKDKMGVAFVRKASKNLGVRL